MIMYRITIAILFFLIVANLSDVLANNAVVPDTIGSPKLMILVEENYLGMESEDMQIAAAELSNRLLARGFTLVDKSQIKAVQMREADRQAIRGNIAAVANLGLRFGCQYVIMGKAVAKDQGEIYEGSDLRSIHASLQLQLLQTETAIVLGSVVKSGVAAHINQLTGATKALQDASRKAAEEYLYDEIARSFSNFKTQGAPFNLSISGVVNFKMSKNVYEKITNISGVVSSKKERWNSDDGLLLLSLKFQGNSDHLATLLDGVAIGSKTLEVVDLAQDRVDCNLQ